MGSYFLIAGLISILKEKKSIEFYDISDDMYYEGYYVEGEVLSYISKSIENLGNGTTSGISQTLFTAGKEYSFYTVPVRNNIYTNYGVGQKGN